jgi:hypothetical protein
MREDPMNALEHAAGAHQQRSPGLVCVDERLAIKRQGMLGYVLVFPDRTWGGKVFTSRASVLKAQSRDPGAWLFMVNPAGALFHEREGRAISRVGVHPMIPECIDIRPATRRRMKRATAARA